MGIKLVVADDAPFIREVVRQSLEGSGVQIVGEAANGVEAVEVVSRTQPDVVLMDIVMPLKSGVEATREILAEFPHIKVLACSTLDQKNIIDKALNAGCVGYVTKPFEIQGLREAISKAFKEGE